MNRSKQAYELGSITFYRGNTKVVYKSQEEVLSINFALNSSRLSKIGRDIVKLTASKISSQGASRVMIVGHTDQSGNPEYNLRLSRKRTEIVIQSLIQEGVSPTILKADWKGEFDPEVPAGENDLEPRNRRVVIYIE